MPWIPGPGLGFTSGEPWLPLGGRRKEDTVAAQDRDPGSHLNRTRALLAVRRSLSDLRSDLRVEWLTSSGPVIAYRRGNVILAANCGLERAQLQLPAGDWEIRFASQDGATTDRHWLNLATDTAAMLTPRVQR